eukprot:1181365-Prorocentrum_minimum.AAC.4
MDPVHLVHCRDNFGCAEEILNFLGREVGHTNCSNQTLLNEGLHGRPSLTEGGVDRIARLDILRTVLGVPQLASHENLLARTYCRFAR